jgi:hypothetical protein
MLFSFVPLTAGAFATLFAVLTFRLVSML